MASVPDYYPKVNLILEPLKNNVGEFKGGPTGVTIHYTASRDLKSTHNTLLERGLNYHMIIDRDGMVTQTAIMTQRVHHAGPAAWRGKSPNRHHIAIALLNWGRLNNGRTWAGQGIPREDIVTKKGVQWHKATAQQERALLEVCRWLVCMGIDPDMICGHDECCLPKGRKTDPGGILSYSMPKLRRLVTSAMI